MGIQILVGTTGSTLFFVVLVFRVEGVCSARLHITSVDDVINLKRFKDGCSDDMGTLGVLI